MGIEEWQEEKKAEETAAERNARIQAAFNKASASMPTTATPDMPAQEHSIFGEPIDLSPGAQIGLSFADKPLSQTSYQDERQYALSRFDPTQPASSPSSFYSRGGIPQGTPQDQIPFGMMRGAASLTSQSLFGGYDPGTGGFFEGAYDRQGNLINPDLKPNMLTPELAQLMWPYASEAVRISLGYNPEAPYNLQEEIPGGSSIAGGGGGGGGGGRRGVSSSGAGAGFPRYSNWGLTMWRIT